MTLTRHNPKHHWKEPKEGNPNKGNHQGEML